MIKQTKTKIHWENKEIKAITQNIFEKLDSGMKHKVVVASLKVTPSGRAGRIHGIDDLIMAAQMEVLGSNRWKNATGGQDVSRIKAEFIKLNNRMMKVKALPEVKVVAKTPAAAVNAVDVLEIMERKVSVMRDIKALKLPKEQEACAMNAILA